MRGYVLQEFGWRRPWLGLLVSSTIFAVLHFANPGALSDGVTTAIVISLSIAAAGLLLGALFLRAGDLWLTTGLHYGWNWAQGVLLGLPVSGMKVPSVAHGELLHRSLLTGSAFGPESSLIALLVVGAAALVLAANVLRTNRRVPGRDWRRSHASRSNGSGCRSETSRRHPPRAHGRARWPLRCPLHASRLRRLLRR